VRGRPHKHVLLHCARSTSQRPHRDHDDQHVQMGAALRIKRCVFIASTEHRACGRKGYCGQGQGSARWLRGQSAWSSPQCRREGRQVGRRIVAHARCKQPKEHPSACDARRDDGQKDSLKMAKTGWVDKTLQAPRIGLARGRRRGGENEPPSCSPHRIVTFTAK
jgi:hypothetical protein